MKIAKTLGMGLLVGFFGSTALADSQKWIDVQTVQGWIARKHVNWQAKESWVTRLSKTDVQRMLGLQKAPEGTLDYQAAPSELRKTSTSLDWRNVNGVSWIGPVLDQGNCGSCVAFAAVATLEAQTSISSGIPWLHPTFSPQELFACGGGRCDYGWMPDEAAEYLQRSGISDEACMPYTSGSTGVDGSCNRKCADASSRNLKVSNYSTPTSYGGSVEEVKAALKKGPLVTTLMVYADFITYGSGVYQHVAPGSMLGGHAVSLIGYDDTRRAWLIRNSWGKEWGENGFGWVSWDDTSGVGANTWGFEVSPSSEAISVSSPADREYISSLYQLVTQRQGAKAQDTQFHVRDAQGRELSLLPCTSLSDKGCSAQLDTTTLKEGRYEIYAQAQSMKSQVREFYVVNSEPTLSLSFAGAEGVNLNAPLKGRPEFIITTTSSSVPMQFVEFRAIDESGKTQILKRNSYVLEKMKMGWRTITVPNGQYKIYYHGEMTYKGKVYGVDSNMVTVSVKN